MQLACRLALALRDISQELPVMPTIVFHAHLLVACAAYDEPP